jgi:LmbE family N-acetylglucosaminyl deacetylase
MRILAVGAHLDDIEISCGGLLADAAMNGHEVKMIVLSDSAYTIYDGRVGRTREEALREGRQAADILGAELEVLDFPTKDVPFGSQSIEALDARIAAFKPHIVLTHWPYDTHPSHRNTALATLAACRYHNNVLMYEPMMPSGRSYHGFRGQLYYAVSPEGVKKKIEALKAHRSQYKKYGEKVWVDAVIARGTHRGFEIGAENAECFEVVRWQLRLRW